MKHFISFFTKMIDARQREIEIRQTGREVTIPNASMARLMYYLHSVNVITDFGIPNELTNYNNYNSLSFDQENQVLALAILLNPDVFIEKGIMINSSSLCGNYNNQFYEITDRRTAVAATRQFVIAGKTVHTLKIMAFEMCWMRNYFTDPISYYERRISAIANGTVESMRPRQITYSRPSESSNYNRPSESRNYNRPSESSNYNPYSYDSSSEHHHHHRKHKKKSCLIC